VSKSPLISRRRFLIKVAAALGAGWLALFQRRRAAPPVRADDLIPRVYLPLVTAPDVRPRVVHIRHSQATHWDFTSGWYGDHVDQAVVSTMLQQGLRRLTDTASVSEAWRVLLPAYQPGQRIAVKVNLVNADCGDNDNVIDALIEPVNALIGSLVEADIREEDVWVYDASRPMPSRFYGRRQYRRARFIDSSGCADARATFKLQSQSLRVFFSWPGAQVERWLTDVLHQATYVINLPIAKRHVQAPVTLGFKNHFGSLNDLGGPNEDNPHSYIDPTTAYYNPAYQPVVDIYANPNIADKTVLTIGDMLFGAPSVHAEPIPWQTFGQQAPNSLLFSRDPVAIDCVLCDLLRAEWGVSDAAHDYLRLAETRGLGVYERGEPWSTGYQRINYLRVELPEP
jgi:hypothetical protein